MLTKMNKKMKSRVPQHEWARDAGAGINGNLRLIIGLCIKLPPRPNLEASPSHYILDGGARGVEVRANPPD